MSDRYICTKENPWSEDKGMAIHPDAKLAFSEDGSSSSGGSYDRYICPNCNLRFWVTIAD